MFLWAYHLFCLLGHICIDSFFAMSVRALSVSPTRYFVLLPPFPSASFTSFYRLMLRRMNKLINPFSLSQTSYFIFNFSLIFFRVIRFMFFPITKKINGMETYANKLYLCKSLRVVGNEPETKSVMHMIYTIPLFALA